MSNQLNELCLIRLVEKYPILYDKEQARGQRNAERKDLAWRELSLQLKASERACITRWKSIRDRFGKEYRRIQEYPEEPTNWDLFPHLLFLQHHYKSGTSADVIATVKYEPKERKRKSRNINSGSGENCSQGEDESNNEEDIKSEELVLNQQLIGLVKDHSVIYDKCKIRDSKNLILKNEAWVQISQALGLSEEDCYKRWKKLRDRFSREFRYKQINPQKPVTWIYFNHLSFLEAHYRKGIPLNINDLKVVRKAQTRSQTETNPWGNDYPICSGVMDSMSSTTQSIEMNDEHEHDTISDTLDSFHVIEDPALDELLLIPPEALKNEPTNESSLHCDPNEMENVEIENSDTMDSSSCLNEKSTEEIIEDVIEQPEEAEDKLHDVIINIESVLKQSKDCLQVLQQQKERHREELQANVLAVQPTLVQKVHILLDGLNDGARIKAERKIIQFLCECQIKSLNNEIIEDVEITQIK